MPTTAPAPTTREASLKHEKRATGEVLTASVPNDITDQEFARVNQQALNLIKTLTKCNCMSGRISYVVEENYAEVIRVNLNAAATGQQ